MLKFHFYWHLTHTFVQIGNVTGPKMVLQCFLLRIGDNIKQRCPWVQSVTKSRPSRSELCEVNGSKQSLLKSRLDSAFSPRAARLAICFDFITFPLFILNKYHVLDLVCFYFASTNFSFFFTRNYSWDYRSLPT